MYEWTVTDVRGRDVPRAGGSYLSTLPEITALCDLVRAAHMRWCIERDYQDLKQDLILRS